MSVTRYLWSKLSIASGFLPKPAFALFLCLIIGLFTSPASAQISDEAAGLEIVALGDSLTAGYGLAPNDGFDPAFLRLFHKRDRSKQVAMIRQGHRRHAQLHRPIHQPVHPATPIQQAVI